MIGREDTRPVEIETRERARRGSRGDHEVAPRDLGTVGDPDAVARTVDHLAATLHDGDVAPLQQGLEALRELVDDVLLAHLGPAQVEHRLAFGDDPELGRLAHRAQHVGRLEQFLGGDAAAMEAGPAHAALFDDRDVQSGSSAIERGGIASRASAEDHNVEFVGQNGHLLRSSSVCRLPILAARRVVLNTLGLPGLPGFPTIEGSPREQDLDGAGGEDRHPGDRGEDQEGPGAHGCIVARVTPGESTGSSSGTPLRVPEGRDHAGMLLRARPAAPRGPWNHRSGPLGTC